jgi:hypothetical protein
MSGSSKLCTKIGVCFAVCVVAQLFAHCFGTINKKKRCCPPLPLAPELKQVIGHVSPLAVPVAQGQVANIAFFL